MNPFIKTTPVILSPRKNSLVRTALYTVSASLAWIGIIGGSSRLYAAPLKVGYSDWPGWVAWDIGIQKGWFKEAGVDIEFVWFEYVPSMDAFSAGKVDAVTMTNGDAMVTGSAGGKSVAILLNDYSNGNDMIVAKPGIKSMADLKGKKIGVEVGFVDHLLLLNGLQAAKLKESDVTLVNMPTDQTAQALGGGQVDAIAHWYFDLTLHIYPRMEGSQFRRHSFKLILASLGKFF